MALAFVLALQAVFASVALGSVPQLDPLGNVICFGPAGPVDPTPGSHDHSGLPDCCKFACSMFWPQLPGPDSIAAVKLPATLAEGGLARPPERVASSFLDHRRAYPRAPPMTA